ncbi:hypothetical protein HanHA300_Chr12g0437791 [Helianthus annuus]|nr:hypothetical protein HanHA300_Chr12g0437791 [Helianthus annuus]KAJ0504721.1 hypothetical protein HanHA89_Chr12g0462451 [Helianthus annuus]KAJ0674453.1 hypothetical protein HanLR1_Chr12g0440131 [Helianthus annuus]
MNFFEGFESRQKRNTLTQDGNEQKEMVTRRNEVVGLAAKSRTRKQVWVES